MKWPAVAPAHTLSGLPAAEETLKDAGSELKGGWPLVVEAFTLTTVAEIGDRSQLATIALSAAGNPLSVCAGATAGHFIATGTAVLAAEFQDSFSTMNTARRLLDKAAIRLHKFYHPEMHAKKV